MAQQFIPNRRIKLTGGGQGQGKMHPAEKLQRQAIEKGIIVLGAPFFLKMLQNPGQCLQGIKGVGAAIPDFQPAAIPPSTKPPDQQAAGKVKKHKCFRKNRAHNVLFKTPDTSGDARNPLDVHYPSGPPLPGDN